MGLADESPRESSGGGLLGPNEIRELADLAGVSPTKKLGQNFVHDPNTVRKIVRLAGVSEGETVIEIGPGLGSLTLGLLDAGARVTAVEIDQRLAELLPVTAANRIPDGQLRVIHRDALKVNEDDLGDAVGATNLVANLPYNVSVPILMHLLELVPTLQRSLVMVQAEVGERIAAGPGNKEYGAPSVKASWYGQWNVAAGVSRKIFWPVPGVDSVLVSFQRHDDEIGTVAEREKTFELVNAAFATRRKMLRQSLQGALGVDSASAAASLIETAGIDPSWRAENLLVTDYLAIARALG